MWRGTGDHALTIKQCGDGTGQGTVFWKGAVFRQDCRCALRG